MESWIPISAGIVVASSVIATIILIDIKHILKDIRDYMRKI